MYNPDYCLSDWHSSVCFIIGRSRVPLSLITSGLVLYKFSVLSLCASHFGLLQASVWSLFGSPFFRTPRSRLAEVHLFCYCYFSAVSSVWLVFLVFISVISLVGAAFRVSFAICFLFWLFFPVCFSSAPISRFWVSDLRFLVYGVILSLLFLLRFYFFLV
jgi:hypothetical protein